MTNIILNETIDLKTGEISKIPQETMEDKIKAIPQGSIDEMLRVELLTLVEESKWMAKVLRIYRDKRNWTRVWNHAASGYNWQFHAGETKGRETMAPDMLMDAIAEDVKVETMAK